MSSSDPRFPTASGPITAVLVIALLAVGTAASRLTFVVTQPQPKAALWFLLLAVLALLAGWVYCLAKGMPEWFSDRIVFGTLALIFICVAASRLMPMFLKNLQPGTAAWWLLAALVALALALFFNDQDGPSEQSS